VNDLQVVAKAKQDRVESNDDAVTKAIKSRLGAHELEGTDIDVAVSNGVARLTGTVKSRRDQVTALTVARTTDGVKKVIDDLRLDAPAVSAR
jgi:osmotically-inducible protein OsmY